MSALLRSSRIIYNVAWEDPRVDSKLLHITEDDTLLMLTTGGCNVLDRLLDGARHIVAVDLNQSQNALLELKLVCARNLSHEQYVPIPRLVLSVHISGHPMMPSKPRCGRRFFQLFACSNRVLFDELYTSRLRAHLSASAQLFWDRNASFFDDVFYAGASGCLALFMCFLIWLFGLQPLVTSLRTCESLTEQRARCEANAVRIRRLVICFDWLLPLLCPFAGVPASQLRLGHEAQEALRFERKEDRNRPPITIVGRMVERVFWHTHIASDNYFYYGYLYGRYSHKCCPRYLQPEHFEALKVCAGVTPAPYLPLPSFVSFAAELVFGVAIAGSGSACDNSHSPHRRCRSCVSGRLFWRDGLARPHGLVR